MRYLLLLLLCAPFTSHAALLISEIAWMGTSVGPNEEWIELYNHGEESVTVDGWTLSDGGSLSITLAGTVPPRSFALLERTDDASVPSVTAFLIYTGALANTGATLTLRDESGTSMDEVAGGENWSTIGGSNETKMTPQRGMTGWVTGAPTPGAVNVVHDETDTTDDTEDDVEDNSINDDDDDDGGAEVLGASRTRTQSGNGSATTFIKSTAPLTLDFTSPQIAYVNQPVSFTALPSGIGETIMASLVYTWNFGDGATATNKTASHVYAHPGDYAVVLYAAFSRHDVAVRKIVRVLPVTLAIAKANSGGITITNSGTHDADISGYMLRGTESFTFPPYSYIVKGGAITVSGKGIGTAADTIVALYDTEKVMVASTLQEPTLPLATLASAPLVSRPMPAPRRVPITSDVAPRRIETAVSSVPPPAPEVLGASSTIVIEETIPLYTANTNTPEPTQTRTVLPYVGLGLVMMLGVAGLMFRRSSDGAS